MHKSKIVFVTLGQPLKPWKLFKYERKEGFMAIGRHFYMKLEDDKSIFCDL